MRPFLSRTPTVDPLTELTPIGSVVESVGCIAVSSSLGVNSMRELVELAKRNPGKLNYASPGVNSPPHVAGELLKQHGIDMVHVPFNGLAPGAIALMGGQVQVAISNIASVNQYVKDGRIKILALTRGKRYEDAPDVPTVGEVIPGYDIPVAFYGMFGPPGLPQPIVGRLNQEIARALESPEMSSKVRELYMSSLYTTPDQFTAMIRSAVGTYAKIIKAAGLKPE
jgi:tripartite-type tricarboxylate transporter receptor subunit TctC